MEPYVHYSGVISKTFCQKLDIAFSRAITNLPEKNTFPDWYVCRENWIQTLVTAKAKLLRVIKALEAGHAMDPTYHGVIVDICLSILADFKVAKNQNFLNPDYVKPELN